jgi:molybdopterin synthase catalytic subunit
MEVNILINGPIGQTEISLITGKMSEMPDAGGHSAFFGQVRADEVGGKTVRAIEYSAYESMVRVEADKIKKLILDEFSDARSVEIVHSTGIVRVGEISLFVLVSAGHRHHAIQACSKTVELIKEKLPVWKKEIYDDDTREWRENNSSHIAT